MRLYRTLTALTGAAIIGYGLYGLLHDRYIGDPLDVALWAGGAIVIHDGLWMPLVCVAGLFVARDVLVRSFLVIAASLTAVGLPAVLREQVDHGNPTLLPLPYLRNQLLLLGCCALACGVAMVVRRRLNRRSP
jgi:hypothetical protein